MVYFIIGFIVGAVLMLVALAIAAMGKDDEPTDKVHAYIARDKDGCLWLYFNKPFRGDERFFGVINAPLSQHKINRLGLNPNDFDNLKWEDEPVEVFINLEK